MNIPFHDRSDAGRQLASRLSHYANRTDLLVLALPRGGVPVAFEVARAIHAPLDLFIVRKVGVPGHEELAMGAIASGGVQVVNEEITRRLRIQPDLFNRMAEQELQELKRRELAYRGQRPAPDTAGRTIILVDDGIATGSTMKAAISALRKQSPERILVGTPVIAADTFEEMLPLVDELVAVITPEFFSAVGQWYEHFPQTGDDEVKTLLKQARVEFRKDKPGGLKPG